MDPICREIQGFKSLKLDSLPLRRGKSTILFSIPRKEVPGQFEKNKLHPLHSVVHIKKKKNIPIKPARIFIGRLLEAKTARLAGSEWTQSDRGFFSLTAEFIPRVLFVSRE